MRAKNDDEESSATRRLGYIPLQRLGWGFLLAWVTCTFYTDIVKDSVGFERARVPGAPLLDFMFAALPLIMAIAMLVVLVAGERRWGSVVTHRPLLWIAPLATAASSPLLLFSSQNLQLTILAFVMGAVLTGFGSGVLWILWGEFYARITQEEIERTASASAVLAALLVLFASAMNGWVALLFIIALPVASGACFFVAWSEVKDVETLPDTGSSVSREAKLASARPALTLRSMGRSSWGILIACLFVSIEGSFWQGDVVGTSILQIIIVLSALFMLLIGVFSTVGPRRISIAFLYRWMCPMLVCGFAAVIVFDSPTGVLVAFGISTASRLAFCLITQMYFARFAARGLATPTQSYGLGWIFVHTGDLLGLTAFTVLSISVDAGQITYLQIAAVGTAALVIATLLVLNNDESFANPTDEENPNDEENRSEDGFQERIDSLAARFDLTPREAEVFSLLMRGRSIPYIRDELVISRETVATHVKHIYFKADVHNRQELLDLML